MSDIISRRKALLRVGALAAVAYATPVLMTITKAQAKGDNSGSGGDGASGGNSGHGSANSGSSSGGESTSGTSTSGESTSGTSTTGESTSGTSTPGCDNLAECLK